MISRTRKDPPAICGLKFRNVGFVATFRYPHLTGGHPCFESVVVRDTSHVNFHPQGGENVQAVWVTMSLKADRSEGSRSLLVFN